MMPPIVSRVRRAIALATGTGFLLSIAANASPTCPEEQATPQLPTLNNIAEICGPLRADVGAPSQFRLDEWEGKLNRFLGAFCHRNEAAGWVRDKGVRDTGPWIGTYQGGKWTGKYYGTHAPVLIWYSPEMIKWLKTNRPEGGNPPEVIEPVPDGAIMVKEMYTAPAAACAGIDPTYLLPGLPSSAVMVRDSKGSHDGWMWGWYGWVADAQWSVDWPAAASAPYPNLGFGQYCTNCHASAKDNSTFASLKNIKGESGTPLVFLSQNFFLDPSWKSLQARIQDAAMQDAKAKDNDPPYNDVFKAYFPSIGGMPLDPKEPLRSDIAKMPPETYDSVWPKPGERHAKNQYLTSDQCIGCHSAGTTGLQFDMTQPGPDGKLINISPYGTWRGSPMGLAGRDPVFFAQLASETEKLHPEKKNTAFIEDTCLGCHGILGQRQHAIDTQIETGTCQPFSREIVSKIPYPTKDDPDPVTALANYGALARDGISCASCHHMVLGKEATEKYAKQTQNVCVDERQKALNPHFTSFASTFTGSFLVGPPDKIYGPFQEPKKKPMKHAINIDPEPSQTIMSSEMCGSCHTVHLPILNKGDKIGHVYEQTTYPEWAFSDFRTGDSPDGPLPYGSGPQAQSCQGCHMPNKDAYGNPYRSKIAAIQEYSNFPKSENVLPATDIDLQERSGFGKHTLVGLNVYLLKMAWQFPDILGIRKTDMMLGDKGIESIPTAENAMLEQATNKTAVVTVGDVRSDSGTLKARVTVVSRVGHKFPSGVGFRRAFLQFSVLDVKGAVLWSSGRTNAAGVIVDENNNPIEGELWWKTDCSARVDPEKRIHQPHYQTITQQNQAQIYQELVSTPGNAEKPICGPTAEPQGELTTSFLSICAKVKDNRILPQGFLKLDDRKQISRALGADDKMAEESGPLLQTEKEDLDYQRGGGDSLVYEIPVSEIKGTAASVQATLYYQPTPPFYLQDRFCTSKSDDTKRLYYLAGKVELKGSTAADWRLRVVTSGPVPVPAPTP